jgi:DNA-binding NarL/FixJ family response regulator
LPEGYIVKPFKKKDILATLEIVSHRIISKRQKTKYLTFLEINATIQDEITPKEYDVMADIADGLSNEDLCTKHYISLNTVKTHIKRIFIKLDITSRSQIAGKMYRK